MSAWCDSSPGDSLITVAVDSNETVDASGKVTSLPTWLGTCLPGPGGQQAEGTPSRAPAGGNSLEACFARLTAEGYRQRVVYQPVDRFWTLQWRESALYLGLAGLVGGLGAWWLRERTS